MSLRQRVDQACDVFEQQWRSGERPRIESLLESAAIEDQEHLLRELIALEWTLRHEAGEEVSGTEYQERFAKETLVVPPLVQSLAERFSSDQVLDSTVARQCNEESARTGQRTLAMEGSCAAEGHLPESIGRYQVVRVLGRGAFGVVYLAHDSELDRQVALKLPRLERFKNREALNDFVQEARSAAQLDHPGIVRVYDVQREPELVYVVQQYIDGPDLTSFAAAGRLSPRQSAELLMRVAEAVGHAHRQRCWHRDLKPANLLMDSAGHPHVADFGLALHESVQGERAGERAGTPAYMSPEQVRGEAHRLDGRSDIWSLGVIFYELLTGQRPFAASSLAQLQDEIQHRDPKPPRMIAPAVPRELARICLNCLAKRATDRYQATVDLIDDLRHWLEDDSPVANTDDRGREQPPRDLSPVKVIPKGLRSFDAGDADFFLDLLPGPHDRQGLPKSIRFWKTQIERTDADEAFGVGLIYGPSGSGKSSLVKAGLLPRLSDDVLPVYVESTAAETEVRLIKALQKRCCELSGGENLPQLIAGLRSRGGVQGRKVLLVLDQFEQWLHAHESLKDNQLVPALRQCDGVGVQCLVLVRDDFQVAVNRFFQSLEIALVEGHNSALVDLFDVDHARQVLMAFGRAYGKIPELPAEPTAEQARFLDCAVEGLAQQHRVISVRLAVFSEMMKIRPWTEESLREVGGTEGVGFTFLEETFNAKTAPPSHRLHQAAVGRVLQALLPAQGSGDIKGQMKSHEKLLQASGYADKDHEFNALLSILDSEVRLITPTEPDQTESDATQTTAGRQRYYQLTHDFLVPSLREWLTRKQKETRRGRVELQLAERAALWNAKTENRHLPSWWELVNILALTRRDKWDRPQQQMIRRATWFHGVRTAVAVVAVALFAIAAVATQQSLVANLERIRVEELVNSLQSADIRQVAGIVDQLKPYGQLAQQQLAENITAARDGSSEKLNLSLARLAADAGQLDHIYRQLMRAEPKEFAVIRDFLRPHAGSVTDRLWEAAATPQGDVSPRQRAEPFRAACALATYDPNNSHWQEIAGRVVDDLVALSPASLGTWKDSLQPVSEILIAPLVAVYRDPLRDDLVRSMATAVLADFAKDSVDTLAELIADANPKQFAELYPVLRTHAAGAVRPLQKLLDETNVAQWADPPLDPAWLAVKPATRQSVEAAAGMLDDRFAVCQTMRLDQFLGIAESLRLAGYRPIRLRPFVHDGSLLVAAIWTRDGRGWRLAAGKTAEEITREDEKLRSAGFAAVDVSGFVVGDGQESYVEQYSCVWVKRQTDADDARIYVGALDSEHANRSQTLEQAGYSFQSTLQSFRGLDGQLRYCGVKCKAIGDGSSSWNQTPNEYGQREFLGKTLWDIDVCNGAADQPDRRYSAVWQASAQYESEGTHGLDPEENVQRFQQLRAQSYRPAAISVASMGEHHDLVAASVWQRPVVLEQEKESLAQRQANAAVALLKLGEHTRVWHCLRHSPDPRLRTWIIHRLNPLGVSSQVLAAQLGTEPDVSVRRALVRAFGEYEAPHAGDQDALVRRLLGLYEHDPDPGVHAAAEWTLRRWQQDGKLQEIAERLAASESNVSRDWHVTRQGHTMVTFSGPLEFTMGSPGAENGRYSRETLHRRRIDRSFAIASKEVTVKQFHEFLREVASVTHNFTRSYAPEEDCPQISVTWYEAASYCRWLSEKEGVPEDQMCYPEMPKIKEGMELPPGYLTRTGYRLPTEAEWEYACRANARTSFCYGESEQLLTSYGWYAKGANHRSWPVGSLRPNDLGLFDMHGNVFEWCQEGYLSYRLPSKGKASTDSEDLAALSNQRSRVLRGGAFYSQAQLMRSACRSTTQPVNRDVAYGFRLARTYD